MRCKKVPHSYIYSLKVARALHHIISRHNFPSHFKDMGGDKILLFFLRRIFMDIRYLSNTQDKFYEWLHDLLKT